MTDEEALTLKPGDRLLVVKGDPSDNRDDWAIGQVGEFICYDDPPGLDYVKLMLRNEEGYFCEWYFYADQVERAFSEDDLAKNLAEAKQELESWPSL